MRFEYLLVFAALLNACSDKESKPIDVGTPDAGNPYDDPSDFDHQGCTPGSLAAFDVTGIWHADIQGDDGFPEQFRIDKKTDALTAMISGRDAQILKTDDDLFLRVAYPTKDGKLRVRALDACVVDAQGNLLGGAAYCTDTRCFTDTFLGVKLKRIAGENVSSNVDLVSEFAGDAANPWPHVFTPHDEITVNVRVKNGIAYMARYEDGLRIVDVSDPVHPKDLAWSPVALPDEREIFNDVKIVDGPGGTLYALMASSGRGIVVIDVTNINDVHEVADFPPPPKRMHRDPPEPSTGWANVHTLVTETRNSKTYAYIAYLDIGGLGVYDITDPAKPIALGTYTHPGVDQSPAAFVHDLYVENGIAYLDYWDFGLIIVDATDPTAIKFVGQYKDYPRRTNHSNWVTTANGRKISLTGDEDFGAHVQVIDVDPSSAEFMKKIGEFSLRPEVSVHNITAFGNTAYIAYYQDGFRMLDLSDPTHPKLAGYYNTWDGRDGVSFYEGAIGIDVDLAKGLVYIADTARGLFILKPK